MIVKKRADMFFNSERLYRGKAHNKAMKATMNRLERIELKMNRLREMMSGDRKEFSLQKPRNVLGIARLRRA